MQKRNIPHLQHYNVAAYRGTDCFRSFRISNVYGEKFNFSGVPMRAQLIKTKCGYCKPIDIEYCIEGNDCDKVGIYIPAWQTQELECCRYTFYIDINPIELDDAELDRPVKLFEIATLGLDRNLNLSDYATWRELRKLIPQDLSFRIVHGIVDVKY